MLHPNAWIHRTSRWLGIALAASSLAGLAPYAAARPADGPCQVEKQLNVAARMRDGVTLYADVYRPRSAGSYPVILMRLPYNKDAAQTYVYAPPEFYASHCYIVVIQDVRGQYTSEGSFYAFRDEAQDGYDTIEWAAKLPGANGKVGMYGFSYVGATQWMPATLKPPSLVTIVPAMTSSDYYDGWSYEGGAWSLAFEESWPLVTIALTGSRRLGDQAVIDRMNEAIRDLWATYKFLPIKEYPWLSPDRPKVAPYFYDWIKHNTWDDYWKQWSIRTRYDQVQVPALNFSGWYDVFMNGAIENFVGMRAKGGSDLARKGQKLVVGPWIHLPWQQKVGEVDFGPEAANPVDELQLRWFDYWLKGKNNGVSERPGSARVRDGREQVAHGRGLADSGHSVHGVLLAQPRRRQYSLRQRLAHHPEAERGRITRSVPLRSRQPGAQQGWPFLLHRRYRAGRSVRPGRDPEPVPTCSSTPRRRSKSRSRSPGRSG